MSSYLKVVYSEESRPYTAYPQKLCRHLFQRFHLSPGQRLLEVGCGRGEFLGHFKDLGLDVSGADIDADAPSYRPDITIKVCDLEREGMPYPDAAFDVVYSKSLVEHLRQPERYFMEARRVLKPGGLLLSLVPDWESNYKTYFDDYTHRTPFTVVSLEDIYKIFGFQQVSVTKFRQLPVVWQYPVLNYVCAAVAPFVPVRTKTTFLRWSRELMLCGSGRKPVEERPDICRTRKTEV